MKIIRSLLHLGDQTGLTSSIGLASLCGVYALAYGIRPTLLPILSAIFLFWCLFLADRIKDPNPGEGQPSAFAQRHPRLSRGLLLFAVSGLLFTCWMEPKWLLPILGVLVCGMAYFTPVPGLGKPLKDIPGFKSLYAATVILAICHLYVWPRVPETAGQWMAIVAVLLLEQVSNAVYDMKDVDVDREQGIKTLILLLGKQRFLLLEGSLVFFGGIGVLLWSTPASTALAFAMYLHVVAMIVLSRRAFDKLMSVGLDGIYASAMLIAIWVAA
ncbi:MAG: hypothetical protein EP343_02350 [Deltaproteobacteria bacterium]|nr:MAG: hypothetical protein EP343_02350 [Deltaproteobacteria bacterium]